MAIDGSRVLICPLTGVVVLSSLQNHAAMRLPPRKSGAPEKEGNKDSNIGSKDIYMAFGDYVFQK